jgi:hypothetical protein
MGDRGRKECVEDSETSWGVEPNARHHLAARRLRWMVVLADQCLCLGRWRTSKQAIHT